MNRRTFLAGALASLAARARQTDGLNIGITDWNLRMTGRPEALVLARQLGFDGLQVSIGRRLTGENMPLDDEALIARYRSEAEKAGIPIDGTCLDRLHDDCLKSDSSAARRITDGIRITAALGVRVMLVPFFGKCELAPGDLDRVGDALRELAPAAEKAGVVLGLENTRPARDNVRIMDRAKSRAVLVYYDVGNSTAGKYDVLSEIRWLGAERICQFHLKDNPHYLGEGPIDFAKVLEAIRDIGFAGYANLETDPPSGSVEKDLQRNLAFVRGLMNRT
jgi:L-ribulose-5-phosphate 3-epimerase